jgi:predicted membrane protein
LGKLLFHRQKVIFMLGIVLLYGIMLYLLFGFLFALVLLFVGYLFGGPNNIFRGQEAKLIILLTLFWAFPKAFDYFGGKVIRKAN